VTTAEKALFIAANAHVIANREDAGKCLADARWIVEQIERMVNRPRPKKYCGNCPTTVEDEERCATPLYADSHEAVQVTCWRCKCTYVIEDLIKGSLDNARGLLYNEKELLEIMAHIGEHIPRGTWWSWRQRGVIVNKNEWGAEPRYLLEDARELFKDKVGKRTAS
jgi:hypothetical protein